MTDIISSDYHRNGVGGEGFYVALVTQRDGIYDPETHVLVWFPNCDDEGEILPNERQTQIAELDVARLAAGDVAFGSNSWRGADNWRHLCGDIAQAFADAHHVVRP